MFPFVNGAVLRSVRVVSALLVLVSVAVVFPDRNLMPEVAKASATGLGLLAGLGVARRRRR